MRVRENRADVWQSLSTTVRIKNREDLLRHISGKLRESGAAITDDMVHVTHYGYDDRIDWDEYIIVVEGFGVFGYADGPCPGSLAASEPAHLQELEIAFAQPAQRRRIDLPKARSSRAAKQVLSGRDQRQSKTA